MATAYTLDFEKPLLELERQIEELRRVGSERQIDVEAEAVALQKRLETLRAEIYTRTYTLSLHDALPISPLNIKRNRTGVTGAEGHGRSQLVRARGFRLPPPEAQPHGA